MGDLKWLIQTGPIPKRDGGMLQTTVLQKRVLFPFKVILHYNLTICWAQFRFDERFHCKDYFRIVMRSAESVRTNEDSAGSHETT